MMGKRVGSRRVFSFCFLFSLCLHGGALFFLQNFYSFRTDPHFQDKSFAAREKMMIPARREDSPILRLAFHQPSSHKGSHEKSSLTPAAVLLQKEKEDFGMIRIPSFLGKKSREEFVPLRFSIKQKEQKRVFSPTTNLGLSQKPLDLASLKAKIMEKKPPSLPKEPLAKTEPPPTPKEEVKPTSLPEEPIAKAETPPTPSREEGIEKSLPEEPVAKVDGPSVPPPTPSPYSEISPFHCKSSLLAPQKASFPKTSKKGSLFHQRPPLSFRMPSSSDLHILSCSNDFDVDVAYNLRDDAEGYLFALSLIPKKNLSFQKIKQNYLFLLDRSHSIGEERFFSTKAALFSALSLLDKEDTFNIVVFDKKSESLFEKNMPVNSSTVRHAKEFLQKQKIAGFFTTTNISKPLFLGAQQLMKETGNKTIIYFSNGDSLDKGNHKKAMYDWTQRNKGTICFYSMIQKGDKKGGVLAYLSAVNKGKLYISQTSSGFKRQLRKLMNSIRFPFAQSMEAYVYLKKEGTDVTFYPSLKQMPNLYLDQPFVLIGTTKKLEPFTLFLQGKNKDQWFHIKKEISFQESRPASHLLYEEWALQNAYRCYDAYLQDGNDTHLDEAKEFLTPYRLEEAFR